MPEQTTPPEVLAAAAEMEKQYGPEISDMDTRNRRVDSLKAKVRELFPGEDRVELRETIERSFLTPQVGDYHNEGMFMDSHLDLILKQIEQIADGSFPDEVPGHVREAMKRAIARDRTAVEQYVFLHDIAKPDCMTLKKGEVEQAVTWPEWTAILQASPDGQAARQGDEAALKRFCQAQGITGVSYRQTTAAGDRQHGEIGVETIRATQAIDDEATLTAIGAHEVAFQFSRVSMPMYEKYFRSMPEPARDFALTASFVDTMASLRLNGKPNLENFLFLVASKEKAEQFAELLAQLGGDRISREEINAALQPLAEGGPGSDAAMIQLLKKISTGRFDAQALHNLIAKLRTSDERLTAENLAAALAGIIEKVKLPSYNADRVREGARALVDGTTFTDEDLEKLISLAATDPTAIGREFGKKLGKNMGKLRGILEAAKE